MNKEGREEINKKGTEKVRTRSIIYVHQITIKPSLAGSGSGSRRRRSNTNGSRSSNCSSCSSNDGGNVGGTD